MSEEIKTAPDISRVISVIMENPEIIEKISALMNSEKREAAPPPQNEPPTESETQAVSAAVAQNSPGSSKRTRLLTALKPYVKSKRAEAIDSVIAIADIIDMMRR